MDKYLNPQFIFEEAMRQDEEVGKNKKSINKNSPEYWDERFVRLPDGQYVPEGMEY